MAEEGRIREGMIVRYAPQWCSPGEEKYLHVVKERRLNPVTGEMTRWLITTINSKLFLPPSEVVDDEMLMPIGPEWTIENCDEIANND